MDMKELCTGGVSIALLSICSWITIPFTIPFTLQTFLIFLIIFFYGGKKATIYIGCYILCGLAGFPVFSSFRGGLSVLLDLSGGYILGFLISSLFMWSTEKLWSNHSWHFLWTAIVGLFLCYGFGTFWFLWIQLQKQISFSVFQTLMICVIPFVIPDLIKIWFSYQVGKRLKPFV